MNTVFYKTKKDIISWLDEHKVKNYKLVEDLTYGYAINVEGEVNLSNLNLTIIPVKFNVVSGNFYCSNNQLTSLEFCPSTVGGDFYCHGNPPLKDIQKISDFSQILAFHKETLIQIEQQHISEQLKQTVRAKDNANNIFNKVLFKL